MKIADITNWYEFPLDTVLAVNRLGVLIVNSRLKTCALRPIPAVHREALNAMIALRAVRGENTVLRLEDDRRPRGPPILIRWGSSVSQSVSSYMSNRVCGSEVTLLDTPGVWRLGANCIRYVTTSEDGQLANRVQVMADGDDFRLETTVVRQERSS